MRYVLSLYATCHIIVCGKSYAFIYCLIYPCRCRLYVPVQSLFFYCDMQNLLIGA